MESKTQIVPPVTAQAGIQSQGSQWLQPAGVQEIARADWPAFCEWFTKNFGGLATSLERHEGRNIQSAECLDLPLQSLQLHMLEDGVEALTVVVEGGKPRKIQFDVNGPQRMTLHANSSGWPTRLAIRYEEGEAIAHFTGGLDPSTAATGNSWGE
ncbi:MAG: hypothetical protein LAP21_00880 [Acidobacteriia bacterium]|nr:hypothetical protein [Terriglobia bacterium]